MKQIDFENGNITKSIFQTAMPMLAAQVLNLLYNIVDRIYIGRIPDIGTTALGAVGMCFPIITIIMAFTNLYASGGAPLFSIERGRGNTKEAHSIMNTSFYLLVVTAVFIMIVGWVFGNPILTAFGASTRAIKYSLPYLNLYLLGTLFSMVATGMNPFINAQGYSNAGMMTVAIGAVANIILDPVFIFVLNKGVQGAAIATVLSQALSAFFVWHFLRTDSIEIQLSSCSIEGKRIKRIISLGLSGFIMQLTNSVVQIVCNNVLVHTGGDLYVSIMTIVSSVRQMLEIPMWAITDGSSPIISFNYGANHPKRIKKALKVMFIVGFVYSALVLIFIQCVPAFFIQIFSNDGTILKKAIPALHMYFAAFIFMVFQYCGQTMFKSLNMRTQAIFFSLLRKAMIVIPLTYILPYVFHMGTNGVFIAEPISNVVGGLACFATMMITVYYRLLKNDEERIV